MDLNRADVSELIQILTEISEPMNGNEKSLGLPLVIVYLAATKLIEYVLRGGPFKGP